MARAASLAEAVALGDGSGLPVVVLRGALDRQNVRGVAACVALFARHRWTGAWQNGIYAFHHFHPRTHEALGIVRGSAEVQFGGAGGPLVRIAAGDVVVIPAGVSHRRRASSDDLVVVGAYPGADAPERDPGIERGDSDGCDACFAAAGLPAADPAFGPDGPLLRLWRDRGG